MILNSHFFVKDLSSQVFKWPRSFLPSVVFTYESLRSTKIMVLLFLEIMQPQCQIHVQVWYKPTLAKGFSINLAQEIITSCLGHNMAFTTIPSLIFSYLSLRCFCHRWLRQKLSLQHSYHIKQKSDENKKNIDWVISWCNTEFFELRS